MTNLRVAGSRLTLLVALAVLLAPRPARADERERCLERFERAQRSRKDGALGRAKTEFTSCAVASCPAMVRKDCTDALAALGTTIPTIRVRLRDERGREIESFDLSIDGELVTEPGKPIELDPGEHVLRFEADGGRVVERRIVLEPGSLNVPVVAELSGGKSERAPERESAGTPLGVYALSGVAVLGLGAFVGFGLAGKNAEGCKGSCSDSEIDDIHRKYLFADIGLAVALVSGGVAGYLWLSRPSSAASHERAAKPRPAPFAAGLAF